MNHAYHLVFGLLLLATLVLWWRPERRNGLRPFDLERTKPLRGALALLVVAGHCDNRMPGSLLAYALHLSTPAVGIFFFMSGYGVAVSVARTAGRYLDGFLGRSAIKLFVPWLTALFVDFAFRLVIGDPPEFVSRWRQFLLNGESVPPHSWYVFSLFASFLVVSFSFRGQGRMRGVIVFAIYACVSYALLRFAFRWEKFWWLNSFSMLTGILWAIWEDRICAQVAKRGWRAYALAACVALLVWIVFRLLPRDGIGLFPVKSLLQSFRYALLGPMLVLSMWVLDLFPRWLRLLPWLGGLSYEIYLLHFVGEFGFAGHFENPTIYLAAVLLLAIGLAAIVHPLDAWIVRKLHPFVRTRSI